MNKWGFLPEFSYRTTNAVLGRTESRRMGRRATVHTGICDSVHRHTGCGVRGRQLTPQFGQIRHLFEQKTRHNNCLTNCVTERNKYLPEIRFGWGNKGDVHRVVLYDRQKIGTAIIVPAKLGLTPQMEIGWWSLSFGHNPK